MLLIDLTVNGLIIGNAVTTEILNTLTSPGLDTGQISLVASTALSSTGTYSVDIRCTEQQTSGGATPLVVSTQASVNVIAVG